MLVRTASGKRTLSEAGSLGLLAVAAIVANLGDFATFLRVNPARIAANELSPLPQILGQSAGALAAKALMAVVLIVTVAAFHRRPRTAAALLGFYTILALVGAASNTLLGH
jgi:hypothetical protein